MINSTEKPETYAGIKIIELIKTREKDGTDDEYIKRQKIKI